MANEDVTHSRATLSVAAAQRRRRRWAAAGVAAALAAVGAGLCLMRWYGPVRVAYLSWKLRPPGDAEALAAIQEILTIRERSGQLGVITVDNLRHHLGLSIADAPLPPWIPLPSLEDEDDGTPIREFTFAFTGARRTLILRFAKEDGTLRSWELVERNSTVF